MTSVVSLVPAAGRLRLSVGSAPFGFGVDDPATRRGRLQTLGLRSARLAAPLVPSGRAFTQLRVPAVAGNLAVGGFAPLRPGLDEPVRGERRPTNHRPGHLDQRGPRRSGRRSQPLERGRRIQALAVDDDLHGLLEQRPVVQGSLKLVGKPAGDPRRHSSREQAGD